MLSYVAGGNSKGAAVLFLHGWGGDTSSVEPLRGALESEYMTVSADLYGFGKTPHPDKALTLNDYAAGVKELLDALNIPRAVFVGHSFGGRVAIRTAVLYPDTVSKLVLIDAAGLKPRGAAFKKIRAKIHKILKFFNDRGLRGSSDYEAAEGKLRQTFVSVVNEYQDAEAAALKCGALIVWGARDKATPPYMAKRFSRLIADSELHILPDAGHFAYLDKLPETLMLIKAYIAGE